MAAEYTEAGHIEAECTEAVHIEAEAAHIEAECTEVEHTEAGCSEAVRIEAECTEMRHIEAARTAMRRVKAHIAVAMIEPAATAGAPRPGCAQQAAMGRADVDWRTIADWWTWAQRRDFQCCGTYRNCNPRRRTPPRPVRPRKTCSAIATW